MPSSKKSDERSFRHLLSHCNEVWDSIPFPLLLVQRDGTILLHNRALTRWLPGEHGKGGEVIFRNLTDVMSPENVSRVSKLMGHGDRSEPGLAWIDVEFAGYPARISCSQVGADGLYLISCRVDEPHVGVALENAIPYLLAHNMKAPLIAIEGYCNLLLGDDAVAADVIKDYLARIRSRTEKVLRMIQDTLRLTQSTSRKLTLSKVSVDEVVESVRLDHLLRFKEAGISLKIAEPLPEITADHNGLVTIFSNLVDNSIKYFGSASEPTIEIGAKDMGRFYAFWVRDNGKGIGAGLEGKILDAFERAEAPRDVEGSGVGLAIVKRLVEAHGGQVQVHRSDPGMAVHFTIPK